MAIFSTNEAKALLPREIAEGMITQARSLSTVAQLSNREPMRLGNTDYIVFNDFPKAEFVGEGKPKGSTTGGFTSVQAKPYKAQVTMRFNEEVQWLDEDYQLEVLSELANAGRTALARALDLGVYHRINPLTGATIDTWTNYVGATTKKVEISNADLEDEFRAAVGLLINANEPVSVTGAAIDPKLAWKLASLKVRDGSGPTSQQRFPNLGFGTNVTNFLGLPVAQGNTVSGVPEAADTKVRAVIGDFTNGLRWGVQRELPVEVIRFGDPDGQGDLKRNNQIALRLEIVYGWYVFADRFALLSEKIA